MPEGRIITASLLKITCSSSPMERITSSTSFSYGCQVATIDSPTDKGFTPRRRSFSTKAAGGASAPKRFFFGGRIVKQRPIFNDREVEKRGFRKNAQQFRKFAPRGQHQFAS